MLAIDHDIRRHFDGSIDFGFYRQRAARLRRIEMQAFLAAAAATQVRLAIAVGVLVATLMSLPAVNEVGAVVVHARSHPPVAAPLQDPLQDPAAAFRRTAADLFGIVRLAGDGVRGPWPDQHP